MRAKEAAMITFTPSPFRHVTACSRLDPRPSSARHDDVAGLHVGREGRVEILQRVLRHLLLVFDGVGVLAGEDHVGVHVVAVFPDAAGEDAIAGSWKLVAGSW